MALIILRAIFFKILIPSVRLVLPPFFLLFSKPRSSESPTHPKSSPLDPAQSPRSESSDYPSDCDSPANHRRTEFADQAASPHPAHRAPVGSGNPLHLRVRSRRQPHRRTQAARLSSCVQSTVARSLPWSSCRLKIQL